MAMSGSVPVRLRVRATVARSIAVLFANLPLLLKTSWVWAIAIFAVYVALQVTQRQIEDGLLSAAVGWLDYLASAVVFAPIAVLWHRLIVLGEKPATALYLRFDGVVLRYVWLGALVALVFVAPISLAARYEPDMAVFESTPTLAQWKEVFLLSLGLMAGALVLFLISLRLSLVLPAAAIGDRMTFAEAWRVTRGQTWRLLAVVIILALIDCLLWTFLGGLLFAVSIAFRPDISADAIPWQTILTSATQQTLALFLGLPFVTMLSEAYVQLVGPPAHTWSRTPAP